MVGRSGQWQQRQHPSRVTPIPATSSLRNEMASTGYVGMRRANTVRALRLNRAKKADAVSSTAIPLAPEQLVGKRELERLQHRLGQRRSALRSHVGELRAQLATGKRSAIGSLGTIYVYRAGADLYEMDWELTTVTPMAFEALLLAAHQAGHVLPCQLVLPKPRRGKNSRRVRTSQRRRSNPASLVALDEPVAYGRLSLPLF